MEASQKMHAFVCSCAILTGGYSGTCTQLVINNFSKESFHLKLLATMFQNMFPSINIEKVWRIERASFSVDEDGIAVFQRRGNVYVLVFLAICGSDMHLAAF